MATYEAFLRSLPAVSELQRLDDVVPHLVELQKRHKLLDVLQRRRQDLKPEFDELQSKESPEEVEELLSELNEKSRVLNDQAKQVRASNTKLTKKESEALDKRQSDCRKERDKLKARLKRARDDESKRQEVSESWKNIDKQMKKASERLITKQDEFRKFLRDIFMRKIMPMHPDKIGALASTTGTTMIYVADEFERLNRAYQELREISAGTTYFMDWEKIQKNQEKSTEDKLTQVFKAPDTRALSANAVPCRCKKPHAAVSHFDLASEACRLELEWNTKFPDDGDTYEIQTLATPADSTEHDINCGEKIRTSIRHVCKQVQVTQDLVFRVRALNMFGCGPWSDEGRETFDEFREQLQRKTEEAKKFTANAERIEAAVSKMVSALPDSPGSSEIGSSSCFLLDARHKALRLLESQQSLTQLPELQATVSMLGQLLMKVDAAGKTCVEALCGHIATALMDSRLRGSSSFEELADWCQNAQKMQRCSRNTLELAGLLKLKEQSNKLMTSSHKLMQEIQTVQNTVPAPYLTQKWSEHVRDILQRTAGPVPFLTFLRRDLHAARRTMTDTAEWRGMLNTIFLGMTSKKALPHWSPSDLIEVSETLLSKEFTNLWSSAQLSKLEESRRLMNDQSSHQAPNGKAKAKAKAKAKMKQNATPQINVPCMYCDKLFPQSQLDIHMSRDCLMRHVSCCNAGCSWEGIALEEEEHQDVCPFALEICVWCYHETQRHQMSHHDCPLVSRSDCCGVCNESFGSLEEQHIPPVFLLYGNKAACSHILCRGCVREWQTAKHKKNDQTSCPLCREVYDGHEPLPAHLILPAEELREEVRLLALPKRALTGSLHWVSPLNVHFSQDSVADIFKQERRAWQRQTLLDTLRYLVDQTIEPPQLEVLDVVWHNDKIFVAGSGNRRLCIWRLLGILMPEKWGMIRVRLKDINDSAISWSDRYTTKCNGDWVEIRNGRYVGKQLEPDAVVGEPGIQWPEALDIFPAHAREKGTRQGPKGRKAGPVPKTLPKSPPACEKTSSSTKLPSENAKAFPKGRPIAKASVAQPPPVPRQTGETRETPSACPTVASKASQAPWCRAASPPASPNLPPPPCSEASSCAAATLLTEGSLHRGQLVPPPPPPPPRSAASLPNATPDMDPKLPESDLPQTSTPAVCRPGPQEPLLTSQPSEPLNQQSKTSELETWLRDLGLESLLPALHDEDIRSPNDLVHATDDDINTFLSQASLSLGKKCAFRRGVASLRAT
eukprot:TRINITY_DN28461_c0_g1_i1.p1 TRINITY_DN28461_c0_g1~~TRINITY_DN28461_c0_g1_i1.p1  ORF type:complete len:1240 (-),score=163.91 TRINITY_DN28461_c0_g1_i1:52-3771(-)